MLSESGEENSINYTFAIPFNRKKRFYTHYDPRKTGQNFRIEQTLVSRLNTGKK